MATAVDTARAYDDLLKTTLDNYRGKLVDNVFNKFVLTWLLKDKNRVRMVSGGNQIVEHLLVAENDDTQSYSEWESVDITPQGGIDTARYDWKQLVTTIAISGLEEAKNQGEEEILSLLKARTMQAEKSLQKLVNDQLWGVSADTSGFGSILAIIDSTGEIGGINPATAGNEYWAAQEFAAAANEVDTFTELQAKLTNLYNSASDGVDAPTALIGSQLVYELYELGLTPNVRYTDTRSASVGFTNLLFKGVPFYWDKAAPAGTVIGINPETIGLVGHKSRWFKQSPFTSSPIDGTGDGYGGATWLDARYSVISTFGNITCNDRSKNFKLTGVEAS